MELLSVSTNKNPLSISRFVETFTRIFNALGAVLVAGLALATGAILFFAWLANEMLEGETRAFDESGRDLLQQYATPALTLAMRLATMAGSSAFLAAVGVFIVLGFLMARWRRGAVLFVITMAGATVFNLAIKLSFQRPRPVPFFDTPLPSSYSFPSGHALFSFCFYGALAAIITARFHDRAARIVIWTLAGLLVALVGLSRIYLGVHYPSDVLAGFTAALVWVVVVAFGDNMLRRRQKLPPSRVP